MPAQAITSLQMHPRCEKNAVSTVERVFARCFADIAPFTRHPRFPNLTPADESIRLD